MGKAPKSGINWEFDSLTPTLAQFTVRANFAIAQSAAELAKEIEEWMKAHAPWQDRTGAARDGLNAHAEHHGFRQEIFFGHDPAVEHGIWLEVIQNGRYSIIVPTYEQYDGVNTWVHFRGVMAAASLGGVRG